MTQETSLPETIRLVVFDCDGVLIDSEGPSCRATAHFARSLGLDISDEDAFACFAGKALPQVVQELERLLKKSLPSDTVGRLCRNLVTLMNEEAAPVEGAVEVLKDLASLHVPVRVGSNSSLMEMDAKFRRTGLDVLLSRERIHSANDRGHPKPDPDVYLHAAEQEGVKPEETVVIEDSDTGAEAARRAGMACILFRPSGLPLPSFWPVKGFVRVERMADIMPLLQPRLVLSR